MKDSFKRQLVAILYADVVGYTRLTAADEDGTHRSLTKTLDVLSSRISRHSGSVVHVAGDAVLARFDTIGAALSCAVEVQHRLAEINADVPEAKRVQVRIGVNLGDVIVDRDEIYGDGVNVAVRVQELAEPGGICVSDNVRDVVGESLPLSYEYMGETKVKNIDHPIRTFRVDTDAEAAVNRHTRRASKPSIAVLPFEFIGGGDTALSDGLTEDVIRALSCFRGFSVVAHHSSLLYRGRAVKVQDVGSELQVQYVLEGTVRRADERIRVTVELIEAESGRDLWSDGYDERARDILDLQADVAGRICMTLAGRLRVETQKRAMHTPSHRLETFDYVLQGQALTGEDLERNASAQRAFERAIELDPGCSRAYTGLAVSRLSEFLNDWGDEPADAQLGAAAAHARKAIECDDGDNKPYWVLAEIKMLCGDFESARWQLDKARTLNRNDTDVHAAEGTVYCYSNEPGPAVDRLETAISRNPYHPVWYLWSYGLALYLAGDLEAAAAALRQAVERKPSFFTPYQHLVAVYARLDRIEEAGRASRVIRELNPRFSRETVLARHPFQDARERDRYLDALRRGGLDGI